MKSPVRFSIALTLSFALIFDPRAAFTFDCSARAWLSRQSPTLIVTQALSPAARLSGHPLLLAHEHLLHATFQEPFQTPIPETPLIPQVVDLRPTLPDEVETLYNALIDRTAITSTNIKDQEETYRLAARLMSVLDRIPDIAERERLRCFSLHHQGAALQNRATLTIRSSFGATYRETQLFEQAVSLYQKALEVASHHRVQLSILLSTYTNLTGALNDLRNEEGAYRNVEQSFDIASALMELATGKKSTGSMSVEQATSFIDRKDLAILTDPHHPEHGDYVRHLKGLFMLISNNRQDLLIRLERKKAGRAVTISSSGIEDVLAKRERLQTLLRNEVATPEQLNEGVPLAQELLRRATEIPKQRDWIKLQGLASLATLQQRMGKVAEAEASLTEAQKLLRALPVAPIDLQAMIWSERIALDMLAGREASAMETNTLRRSVLRGMLSAPPVFPKGTGRAIPQPQMTLLAASEPSEEGKQLRGLLMAELSVADKFHQNQLQARYDRLMGSDALGNDLRKRYPEPAESFFEKYPTISSRAELIIAPLQPTPLPVGVIRRIAEAGSQNGNRTMETLVQIVRWLEAGNPHEAQMYRIANWIQQGQLSDAALLARTEEDLLKTEINLSVSLKGLSGKIRKLVGEELTLTLPRPSTGMLRVREVRAAVLDQLLSREGIRQYLYDANGMERFRFFVNGTESKTHPADVPENAQFEMSGTESKGPKGTVLRMLPFLIAGIFGASGVFAGDLPGIHGVPHPVLADSVVLSLVYALLHAVGWLATWGIGMATTHHPKISREEPVYSTRLSYTDKDLTALFRRLPHGDSIVLPRSVGLPRAKELAKKSDLLLSGIVMGTLIRRTELPAKTNPFQGVQYGNDIRDTVVRQAVEHLLLLQNPGQELILPGYSLGEIRSVFEALAARGMYFILVSHREVGYVFTKPAVSAKSPVAQSGRFGVEGYLTPEEESRLMMHLNELSEQEINALPISKEAREGLWRVMNREDDLSDLQPLRLEFENANTEGGRIRFVKFVRAMKKHLQARAVISTLVAILLMSPILHASSLSHELSYPGSWLTPWMDSLSAGGRSTLGVGLLSWIAYVSFTILGMLGQPSETLTSEGAAQTPSLAELLQRRLQRSDVRVTEYSGQNRPLGPLLNRMMEPEFMAIQGTTVETHESGRSIRFPRLKHTQDPFGNHRTIDRRDIRFLDDHSQDLVVVDRESPFTASRWAPVVRRLLSDHGLLLYVFDPTFVSQGYVLSEVCDILADHGLMAQIIPLPADYARSSPDVGSEAILAWPAGSPSPLSQTPVPSSRIDTPAPFQTLQQAA